MEENTEQKQFFSRYFNRELSKDEIRNETDSNLVSLFLPSNFNSIHDSNRAIVIESISSAILRFYNISERNNGYCIILRDDMLPRLKDSPSKLYGKRYTYHGGNCGIFDSYFSIIDRYYRIFKQNGKIVRYDSIPNHTIAHFLCDYLNSDSKAMVMFKWFKDDYFWDGYGKDSIASAFHKNESQQT